MINFTLSLSLRSIFYFSTIVFPLCFWVTWNMPSHQYIRQYIARLSSFIRLRAHLRRFFFRRLRRRGRLLVSPLCKGVVALSCGFRAVAATLGSTSSPASLLPCTGGLVSAPALGPVVAGTSLYTPPLQKSLSTKSERIRRQSPSQVRRRTAWDQKNPIPTTNHVSFGQTHCGL